jgi:hypothetical protein
MRLIIYGYGEDYKNVIFLGNTRIMEGKFASMNNEKLKTKIPYKAINF